MTSEQYTVISEHPVSPNSDILLTSIPNKSKFFTVIELCSTIFTILVDEATQYLLVFTWDKKQFTWTVSHKAYREFFLFLTNPES